MVRRRKVSGARRFDDAVSKSFWKRPSAYHELMKTDLLTRNINRQEAVRLGVSGGLVCSQLSITAAIISRVRVQSVDI